MPNRAEITVADALSDRQLLGAALGDPASWLVWRSVLKAAYALRLTRQERAAFDKVAGGRSPPRRKVRELIAVVSRRGGKGRMSGAVSAFEAALVHHDLAPGETGVCACISPTRAQAEIVQDYARGFLSASPVLRGEISQVTADEIRLANGNMISTLVADHRSLRGRTLLLAVLDEAAFLRGDAAGSDIETARALLPGLATTGGMLMVLSSPFARAGLVYERHREFFGKADDDVLVVAGPSMLFNPTLDAGMIEAARTADPEGAASEWFGAFRSDVGLLFDEAVLEAAVDRDRPLELPPRPGIDYVAFIDASGGAAAGDAYTIAIAHRETDAVVVDVVRGMVGKFDPQRVTNDFAALAKAYGIGVARGDRYAAEWVAAAWAECGVAYERIELTKSAIYLETVAIFARGQARLPDHRLLLRELRLLQRRTGRSGRDVVDHVRGEHDDYAAAVTGALLQASTAQPALWSRESFGEPAGIPPRAAIVFCVLAAGPREIGVVFFARTRDRMLHVIDAITEAPSAQLFDGVIARVLDLARVTRARCGAHVFASSALAAEFARRGQPAHGIDVILREGAEALALGAAIPIGQGLVRLAGDSAKRDPLSPHGTPDDPLRLAALAGCAVAFDPGRELAA